MIKLIKEKIWLNRKNEQPQSNVIAHFLLTYVNDCIRSAYTSQVSADLYALTDADGTYIGQLFVSSNAPSPNVGGTSEKHLILTKELLWLNALSLINVILLVKKNAVQIQSFS